VEIPIDGYDAEPWNGVTDYAFMMPAATYSPSWKPSDAPAMRARPMSNSDTTSRRSAKSSRCETNNIFIPEFLAACGNHSGGAEDLSGIGLNLFAELLFGIIPESRFTLPRIPYNPKGAAGVAAYPPGAPIRIAALVTPVPPAGRLY
jgi:hypothetical protein